MVRQDPLRKFRFRLEIDGLEQASFSEVAIGDASSDAIEYREGDELPTARKLSGMTKYANVTLKWGITDSMELANWHQLIVGGATLQEEIRKTVVIHIQDESNRDKAAFEITRAWPCKYDPSDLNGTGNEVAIDSMELAHEGIRRIQ